MAALLQHPEWVWVAQYRAAILESNDAKLIEKIEEAEAVISSRVQAMDGTATPDERKALGDALNAVRILRQERLGHKQ